MPLSLVDGYCDHCGPDAPRTLVCLRKDRQRICDEIDAGYDYYTCDVCGVGFYHRRYEEKAWIERVWNNTSAQAAQLERYGDWFGTTDKRDHLYRVYKSMWQRALSFAGSWHKRALEVGCHVGHSLKPAVESGLEVWACEPDINAYQYATNKGAEWAQLATLQAMELPEWVLFDIVIMNDTIEHTFTPWQDLQRASKHSRQGGVLMVKTFAEDMAGSVRYIGLGHEWHFPTPTLLQWIHEAGWNIMSVEPNEEWAQVTVWGKKR